uniref:Uncharacterized protein n=1 Tax=Acrobeloides nanus TaxID=290746 RepID=A0A914DKW1_9BILA
MKVICGICFVACATLSIYFAYLEAFADAKHAEFNRRASFISLVAAVCFVGYQAIGFVIIRILDGVMGGCTYLPICLLPCTEEDNMNLPFSQDRKTESSQVAGPQVGQAGPTQGAVNP